MKAENFFTNFKVTIDKDIATKARKNYFKLD